MIPFVSSQQAYFFKNNGYIEFEEFLSSAECDELQSHIDAALLARSLKPHNPGKALYQNSRDLWRTQENLKNLLLSRRMTSLAFGLTNKSALHLACDQFIPPLDWPHAVKGKDLFSIQGLACLYFVRLTSPVDSEIPLSTFGLEPGLIPLPSRKGNILVVHPNLLLNLPKLSPYGANLYLIAYALPTAVYYHNAEDPSNHHLKSLGYHFGDRLIHTHHPLLQHTH